MQYRYLVYNSLLVFCSLSSVEVTIVCPTQLQKHEEYILSNVFERTTSLTQSSKDRLIPFLLAEMRSGESIKYARTSADIYHTLFTRSIDRYMEAQDTLLHAQERLCTQRLDKRKVALITAAASLMSGLITAALTATSLYS